MHRCCGLFSSSPACSLPSITPPQDALCRSSGDAGGRDDDDLRQVTSTAAPSPGDGDRAPARAAAYPSSKEATYVDRLTGVEEEVIPVLYVEDATRAIAWYERLGFLKEWQHQFEPGLPLFASVARGRIRLYLSEHKGDARPNTLIHLNVTNIDAVSEEFGIPVDEAGLAGRECQLEDPDGNRLRVATPHS